MHLMYFGSKNNTYIMLSVVVKIHFCATVIISNPQNEVSSLASQREHSRNQGPRYGGSVTHRKEKGLRTRPDKSQHIILRPLSK